MSFAQEIVCSRCEKRFGLSRLLNLCLCGAPLLVRYDIKKAQAAVAKSSLKSRVASLWRYDELLPLQSSLNRITLGEGYTPLLEAKKLGDELDLHKLWIKDEGQNPTGSFKDRGLSLAISRAKELGVKKAAIPSAGNAGGSFAAYAARAGIEAQSGGSVFGEEQKLAQAGELHAALGDRARGRRFLLRPDLVDDDDLGHVVLDCLDHDGVLHLGPRDLHASC